MSKRLFDLFTCILGVIALSPFFFLISVWIKFDSPGPIFFRQVRVGKGGKLFRIHKFRTMRVNAEQDGRLTVGEDSRITKSGRFLRKYKLDELPQLIDVLVGDMSLVGPRPEVKEFMDSYPPEIREKVLSVRPGITDRASIEMVDENILLSGYPDPRQAYINIILPIKQGYYVDYVRSHTFWGDIRIILETIAKVISR